MSCNKEYPMSSTIQYLFDLNKFENLLNQYTNYELQERNEDLAYQILKLDNENDELSQLVDVTVDKIVEATDLLKLAQERVEKLKSEVIYWRDKYFTDCPNDF